jgi:protein TorT
MLKLWSIVCSRALFCLKNGGRVLCFLAVMVVIPVSTVQAEKAWYPVEVDVWNPPFNEQRQREQKFYTPLERAQKKWRIRVFIPHLKDDYWLGVNYGLIHEARRLEVSLSIFEAGGYDQLGLSRTAGVAMP